MQRITCDIVVVGLGAMGSAALYQLSQRAKGKKIIGLDKFTVPHKFGSTHGESRITRQAIGEGEVYTPLSLRSYEIWRQLERDTGEECLTTTGGLIMASPSNHSLHGRKDFLEETIRAAIKYGIKHATPDVLDIRRRFPQFSLTGNEKFYFEHEAGILHPENCISANLIGSINKNTSALQEEVLSIRPVGNDRVTIFADSHIYEAGQVIMTVGPWMQDFLVTNQYKNLFKTSRQVMYWFQPKESINRFLVGYFPIFIWQFEGGFLYGFPAIGGKDAGVKLASEQTEEQDHPEEVDRDVSKEETGVMYQNLVANRLPGLSSTCVKAETCIYTTTPDSHFIIDKLPEHPQVLIASACSGHGFKHSAAVGQILAELALDGKSSFDISQFKIDRFQSA